MKEANRRQTLESLEYDMRLNFTLFKINHTLKLLTVLREINQNDEFFGINRIRQYAGSAHTEVDDILLRGPPLSMGLTMMELMNAIDCEWYQSVNMFPETYEMVSWITHYLGCKKLGRVIITKLAPGGVIYPHIDEGEVPKVYERFHYVIQGTSGNIFTIDGRQQEMRTGQLWKVNVRKEHSVVNQSDRDRIHLIMDVVA